MCAEYVQREKKCYRVTDRGEWNATTKVIFSSVIILWMNFIYVDGKTRVDEINFTVSMNHNNPTTTTTTIIIMYTCSCFNFFSSNLSALFSHFFLCHHDLSLEFTYFIFYDYLAVLFLFLMTICLNFAEIQDKKRIKNRSSSGIMDGSEYPRLGFEKLNIKML